jgi:hypothetical protein
MKEVFEPLLSAIKKMVFIGIIAIPVLAVIQWISPDSFKPFDAYKGMLAYIWRFMREWGDWLLIVYLSYKLASPLKTYYQIAEKIRYDRLVLDVKRWSHTPYVSPLLYFYLVTPPVSYSPYLKDVALNTFYQQVVNIFRSRVFVDASFHDVEPAPKQTWLQVVGFQRLIPVIVGIGGILGFFIFLFQEKPISLWFTGWERFAIPLLVVLLTWVGQQLYAISVVGRGKLVDKALWNYYQEIDPKIPWREVFPDRDKGEVLTKAWKAATERQQRNYYHYLNRSVPPANQWEMNCPALAPYPYPSNGIPDWADEMEVQIYDQIDRWKEEKHHKGLKVIQKSKGKVVQFEKKKIK